MRSEPTSEEYVRWIRRSADLSNATTMLAIGMMYKDRIHRDSF